MQSFVLVELHNISSTPVQLTVVHRWKQKSTKQSPRWQQGNTGGSGGGYGGTGTGCGLIVDGRSRDEKLGAPDGMEDERDPDVIPAQFAVSNDPESVSFNSSKWPNGNFAPDTVPAF
uniref:Uncharacterized protein n=1 Tax=Anopheles maculatus TaxID=74869 RepID=A0A182T0Y9_9DIPT